MKNLKSNNFSYGKLFYLILLSVLITSSCKKESADPNANNPQKDEKLYNALLMNGIKAEHIKESAEYYLVEGDMLFKKHKTDINKVNDYFISKNNSIVLPEASSSSTGAKGKLSVLQGNQLSQWRSTNYISSIKVENIRVYYDYPSGFNSLWGSAWITALKNWENIPDCKISFYNDYQPAPLNAENSITIVAGIDGLPAYAAAEFPNSDFSAGYRIRINTTSLTASLSESQKVFLLTHELGHCLGFRHTNWSSDGESQLPYGSVLIPGTPSSDASSIMNSASAFSGVPNWSSFSTFDIVAAKTLYPYTTYDKWINDVGYFVIYNNDIPPVIQWNTSLVSTGTVSIELLQFGQSKGLIAQNIPNNGSYSVDYSSRVEGGFTKKGVQLKIISDSNPAINDLTKMFYFSQD
ncbi:M57 family metalloprotease [Pedobacter sp. FW305-3-2-15-E-R2A2]|uniref:M57 family metalloprotease n=1 Tax=Pedobacter sp. FW305-3-2-15-E-R2A2 TaxID=3140251 RepID=UPI003140B1E1